MIAGTGMGLAGGGTGLGMLRTRRRDISIKPNRKLDRKSHRGMIYENEELRLRTIHINAEVEQGQNDIKKLRRENEQLRREIWSLRDEYDKLEEIVKKQKSREDSGEPEDPSGDDAEGSEYSEDDEDENDEEASDNDESDLSEEENKDEASKETKKEDSNPQSSTEKSSTSNDSTPLRIRRNFEDLEVVKEEEESDKSKEKITSPNQIFQIKPSQPMPANQRTELPFYTTSFDQMNPQTTISLGHQTDSPFVFPHQNVPTRPANLTCMSANQVSESCHSPRCMGTNRQRSQTSEIPKSVHGWDGNAYNRCWSPLLAAPPPPAGWQSNMVPTTRGMSTTMTNFPVDTSSHPPIGKFQTVLSQDLMHRPPEDTTIRETGQQPTTSTNPQDITGGIRDSLSMNVTDSPRRNPVDYGFCNYQPSAQVQILRNGHQIDDFDRCMDYQKLSNNSEAVHKLPDSSDNGRSKHMLVPPPSIRTYCDGGSVGWQSDNDTGPSSETSVVTVIPGVLNQPETATNESDTHGGVMRIANGDAKAFFSSENISLVAKAQNLSKNGSRTTLRKSVSYQDLTDLFQDGNSLHRSRSDTILNNTCPTTKEYKSHSHLSVKQCDTHRSSSPDVPEIPKLPSINYKLFSNPFLQNFEQVYQNFPLRAEGSSPITHPLSIQVCESPVLSASPIRMQPSFISPSTNEADCHTCKRKDFERLRLIIPPSKLLDHSNINQPFHVTSFETPSPHTLQIPPLTPYELEALRKMPTGTSPLHQPSRLYRNVPFVPKSPDVYPPSQDTRSFCDTPSIKVPVQTQTSLEEDEPKVESENKETIPNTIDKTNNDLNSPEQPKKRRSFREKTGSVKEKCKSPRSSQRRKNLKKQTSVISKDGPDSPGRVSNQIHINDTRNDKTESRSSSSGHESPKKDQTKRVSLHLSTKRPPSLSSSRTSRSRSVENAKEKRLTRLGALEVDNANSERERTNSISSREAHGKERNRKSSTSSGSVPWCACWGNGCF
ncbi:hypothetical protein QAD02_008725 [Eretmocerus hayati]|uniref:Uncharacterized protein n=1 Tax=Eretmocerus hayati TaxID=131215 RepID=A0ACC2N7W1_9HYME|nr:hypothetical protein QAD02_008725 [Eretmocerus hayati]